LRVASRRHAISRRELVIELDRAIKHSQRFVVGLAVPAVNASHATEVVVVGVHAFRWLASGALDLGLLEPRSDGPYDMRGDLVLQIEDILEPAFEAVCP